ncbi:hypothetical protein EOE48_22010 [Methylobacterium oryzihabitans]|uniref:Uncharacterized protein n=1 Tax=Methylobacterium oryzihabitans TaxID=2499852 RepID=A0A437NXL0_9HYPH|nr:hypothetical protein EOE48_22010 [Methylobacterium oryzihabitans]
MVAAAAQREVPSLDRQIARLDDVALTVPDAEGGQGALQDDIRVQLDGVIVRAFVGVVDRGGKLGIVGDDVLGHF